MEKFHFNQSFATLGHPYLLHYMTFEFQLYIVTLIVFYAFSYCKVNSYFRTITILVQDMENFHSKQIFCTLGHLYF